MTYSIQSERIALSPRKPPDRLRSTSIELWGSPRRNCSLYQRVSLARNYTVKAGKETRGRLTKGITTRNIRSTTVTVEVLPVTATMETS